MNDDVEDPIYDEPPEGELVDREPDEDEVSDSRTARVEDPRPDFEDLTDGFLERRPR